MVKYNKQRIQYKYFFVYLKSTKLNLLNLTYDGVEGINCKNETVSNKNKHILQKSIFFYKIFLS